MEGSIFAEHVRPPGTSRLRYTHQPAINPASQAIGSTASGFQLPREGATACGFVRQGLKDGSHLAISGNMYTVATTRTCSAMKGTVPL